MKVVIKLIILLLLSLHSVAQQTPRWSFVKKKPIQSESSSKEEDKFPWVVYGDRSDNTSYLQPSSPSKLKSVGFMESFYVIDERDNYLELVKYDPSIIGGRVFPRRIKDIKKSMYYGWVEKNKLLLTTKAFRDSSTLYPKKYLTILGSINSISQCATILHKDSVKVFAKPTSAAKVKQYLPLHQYVYVYKYSADKRFCLIGRNAQFLPDSASKDILGWVSVLLVKEWGSKLYFDPRDSLGKEVSFYRLENARVKDKINKPVGLIWNDIWLEQSSFAWYSQLPVQGKIRKNQNTFIKTELPVSLYDKAKRKAFGVDGNMISYNAFNEIVSKAKIYNLIFVIEANKRMTNFLPYLTNILQSAQTSFKENYSNLTLNHGIVIYTNLQVQNCDTKQLVTDIFPLTTNYGKATEYLTSMLKRPLSCDTRDNGVSAMYPALLQATKLLKGHEVENNIIVLIGSVGNDGDEDISPVIDKISDVNSRLLSFQARNIDFFTANNFVLQSQKIIEETQKQLNYSKRQKLVSAADIKEQGVLKPLTIAKNMFFLNYPKESMVQGGIIFPEKGRNMPVRFLQIGLDTLVKQIATDNLHVVGQLAKIFNKVNYQTETFNPLINEDIEQDQSNELKNDNNCFNSDSFMYAKSVVTDMENKAYKLVLNTDEYNELVRQMQLLSGRNYDLRKASSRRVIYRNYIEEIEKAQANLHNKLAIENMRISDALSIITGYPIQTGFLQLYSIDDLKDKKKLPQAFFLTIMKHLQLATEHLIDNAEKNKFQSSEVNYYVLTSKEMP